MTSLGVRVAIVTGLLILVDAGSGGSLRAQDSPDWLRVDVVRVVPERLEDYIELGIGIRLAECVFFRVPN